MVKPSELQVLITALLFAPLLVWTFGGIDLPKRRWLGAALLALLASYVATVAEGFVAPVALNLIEHVLFAVASACFLVASTDFLMPGPCTTDDDAE